MTNIKLTYEYTLDSIQIISASIDRIRATFTSIVAIGGVLANFGKDLPGYQACISCQEATTYYPCLSCYVLKIIAYVFLIAAIGISLNGLFPRESGKIILPEQLMSDEWNEADEEIYLLSLVEFLEKETLLNLKKYSDDVSQKLSWAIGFFGATVILFGLDEILGSSLPVLAHVC